MEEVDPSTSLRMTWGALRMTCWGALDDMGALWMMWGAHRGDGGLGGGVTSEGALDDRRGGLWPLAGWGRDDGLGVAAPRSPAGGHKSRPYTRLWAGDRGNGVCVVFALSLAAPPWFRMPRNKPERERYDPRYGCGAVVRYDGCPGTSPNGGVVRLPYTGSGHFWARHAAIADTWN